MSASNRKVASFLIDHPTDAAFMTGSQLAYHLDLDPATVVRFAQSLGYPGYPELCAEVQASVKTIFDVALDLREQTPNTQAGAWQGGLLACAAAVRSMAGVIVWKDARRFLKILRDAAEVLVVAESADRNLAEWFAHNLRSAGLRAIAIDADPSTCAAVVERLHPGDVLAGVAVTAAGHAVADVLKAGTDRGARAVAVATVASTPSGLAGEITLTCPAGEGAEGGLGSVSFAAIVESLRRALAVIAASEES
jgi:DNA-binding MurR/RpiR family transcriptional regulator